MSTVIVDYESGNLHSAEKAFQRMAAEVGAGGHRHLRPRGSAPRLRVVLPGDGAFPACQKELYDHRGLFEAIEEVVITKGQPFLGICIGMQMLATRGMEYPRHRALTGSAARSSGSLPSNTAQGAAHGLERSGDRPFPPGFDGISTGDHAYFVHSYHFRVDDPAHLLAHVDYAGPITAVVGRDNIVGTQFHPEKSQSTGLRLIANFLNWTP